MRKFIILLFTVTILLILTTGITFAHNADVECRESPEGCKISGNNPLFSKTLDGFWYPGRTLTKSLNLKNSSSHTKHMYLKATETYPISNLKNVMYVQIADNPNDIIWEGSLNDFYKQNRIELGAFNPGVNKNYYFSVNMAKAANNGYQGLETKFNLALSFWEDNKNPLPTPTPKIPENHNIHPPYNLINGFRDLFNRFFRRLK